MTHSTIALACDWRLNTLNQASIDKYEGNYQVVKPCLFIVLSVLIQAKLVEEQAAAKSAIMDDYDFSEIFCVVSGLDASAPSDGSNLAFSAGGYEILRQQIVKVIFEGYWLAAEYVHVGFKYTMAPIFGAEIGVDAEDFLNSCELGSLPIVLQGRFHRVVASMSQAA
jgi:hypothetical protein